MPFTPGPWHEDKGKALQHARFLRALGREVWVESDNQRLLDHRGLSPATLPPGVSCGVVQGRRTRLASKTF